MVNRNVSKEETSTISPAVPPVPSKPAILLPVPAAVKQGKSGDAPVSRRREAQATSRRKPKPSIPLACVQGRREKQLQPCRSSRLFCDDRTRKWQRLS